MLDIGLFFPTIIGSEVNEPLADQMLIVAKKYLKNIKANNNLGYKSTYSADSGIENFEDVEPFNNYIKSKAQEFLNFNGYDISQISLKSKIFVSEMGFGDFHNLHVHPNCILSGVMYLQVPEKSAPIVFSDARIEKRMQGLPRKIDCELNQLEYAINPKKGMLLLWESWLPHFVPKNNSKTGRITMVFNFSLN